MTPWTVDDVITALTLLPPEQELFIDDYDSEYSTITRWFIVGLSGNGVFKRGGISESWDEVDR